MVQISQAMHDSALDAIRRSSCADCICHLLSSAVVARGPRGAGAADDLRPDHRETPRTFLCRTRRSPSASCAPSGRFRKSGLAYETRAAANSRSGSPRCWEVVYLIFNEGSPRRAANTGCVPSSAMKRSDLPRAYLDRAAEPEAMDCSP